jgi:hypothetical protein
MTMPKEPHFFDMGIGTEHEKKWPPEGSLNWYNSLCKKHEGGKGNRKNETLPFPKGRKGSWCGDASPDNMYEPVAVERIANYAPDMKWIVILREPAARAYSLYQMNAHDGLYMQNFGRHCTFEEVIQLEVPMVEDEDDAGEEGKGNIDSKDAQRNEPYKHKKSKEGKRSGRRFLSTSTPREEVLGERVPCTAHQYVDKGFYMDQIELVLEHFDRSQLLVLISEEVRENRDYSMIYEFLGVAGSDADIDDKQPHGASISYAYEPMRNSTLKKLKRLFKPHNERLFEFLGRRIPTWE